VRKVLGRHQIAAVQTTSIDQAAGLINLTTVLAHASGEWIASDWPVCVVSETATPHRMGAALTYARRYALFTLVGIAGEDDLDAPDLPAPASIAQEHPTFREHGNGQLNGTQRKSQLHGRRRPISPLGAEPSAQLRDQLLAEINELASSDDAAIWAYRKLTDKNHLIDTDAKVLEHAFQARLDIVSVENTEPPNALDRHHKLRFHMMDTKGRRDGRPVAPPERLRRASSRYRNHAGCVTANTSKPSPSTLA
jgi:hypothetical protein